MPLIITCGYPSSGKTYRAKQIVRYLEDKINGSITSTAAGDSGSQRSGSADGGSKDEIGSAVRVLSELNLREASSPSNTSPLDTADSNRNEPTISPESMPSSVPTRQAPLSPRNPSTPPQPSRKIYYISDHTLHLPRSAYSVSRTEKDARATLYSAVKRVLSRNDIVVLDSGNYIKGWRYQLYCEAKNASTASCVVHVGVPGEKSREINNARLAKSTQVSAAGLAEGLDGQEVEIGGSGEEDPYDEKVFDELLMRFEEPNAMARWDSPLFTVPWDDLYPPCDQIWAEIVQGVGKDGKNRVIRPNQAALLTPASSTSHLYILDRTTQSIIQSIQTHQREHPEDAGGGGVVAISVPASSSSSSTSSTTAPLKGQAVDGAVATQRALTLTLPTQPLTFPHLQRLRRQFTALHRQQMGGLGMGGIGGGIGADGGKVGLSGGRVAELFVGFLGERFAEL